ncbi:phosphoacetylglucosamine mutase [Hamiltosporidium tvaerminnensis]|uniref:Phosphoacetylglucosamine mutase n=1 Tax=Hamiltosporidium tvaerminnensis TaxID=1176355 RepID=A0A4Q9M2K6_9MICR|nr:phosphoacetylglucosamine mutase [Hamiltosporidium tvaerminnensis]
MPLSKKEILTYLTPLPKNLTKPQKPLFYGTAGYRAHASLLPPIVSRCALIAYLRSTTFAGKNIGIMLTASHNPEDQNGIKFIDHNGDMFDETWEKLCDEIVNSEDKDFYTVINRAHRKYGNMRDIGDGPRASLILGHDTRPSHTTLIQNIYDTLESFNIQITNYQLTTTPELHFLVRHSNLLSTLPPKNSYLDHLTNLYTQLKQALNDRDNKSDGDGDRDNKLDRDIDKDNIDRDNKIDNKLDRDNIIDKDNIIDSIDRNSIDRNSIDRNSIDRNSIDRNSIDKNSIIEEEVNNPNTTPLTTYVDTSNGVIEYKLLYLKNKIPLNYHIINKKGPLNYKCGSDYIKTYNLPPFNINTCIYDIDLCASFDGDADRIVYFYSSNRGGEGNRDGSSNRDNNSNTNKDKDNTKDKNNISNANTKDKNNINTNINTNKNNISNANTKDKNNINTNINTNTNISNNTNNTKDNINTPISNTNISNNISVIDGDSLAVLLITYIYTLINNTDITCGIILTYYSNTSLLDFLYNKGYKVSIVNTGVKNLVKAARLYDIGIYFESNGHGSVIFSERVRGMISSGGGIVGGSVVEGGIVRGVGSSLDGIDSNTSLVDSSEVRGNKGSEVNTLISNTPLSNTPPNNQHSNNTILNILSLFFDPCIGDALSNFLIINLLFKKEDFYKLNSLYLKYPNRLICIPVKNKSVLKVGISSGIGDSSRDSGRDSGRLDSSRDRSNTNRIDSNRIDSRLDSNRLDSRLDSNRLDSRLDSNRLDSRLDTNKLSSNVLEPVELKRRVEQICLQKEVIRVYIRPSGTEECIRVYVECRSVEECDKIVLCVAQDVYDLCGGIGPHPEIVY